VTLRVETITRGEEFDALAGSWDSLVRAMPRPSPFLLHGWLRAWWLHFGEGAELAVHTATRDGALAGAVPLFVRSRHGVRVAEFLGGLESALADALLAPGEGEEAATALAASLLSHGDVPFDVLNVYGLPAGSRLAAALEARGRKLELVPRSEAPVLDLAGGWDAVYREKLSGRRRNLLNRRRRQLSELGDVQIVVARERDELAAALEEAFVLHELRWRGQPDRSTFGTARGQEFHRAGLAALADLGVARIVTLMIDATAVAFHYFMLLEGRMYVHRLAYHPDYARYSAGLVNTHDAIRAAADDGASQVEFLGGAESYKVELADRLEPLYQGLGLARRVRGRTWLASRIIGLRARARLKRSERLRRLYYHGVPRLVRRMRGQQG
jgi:CelD/BcsL family acetyltransferase involved in cellulose biosynthesis